MGDSQLAHSEAMPLIKALGLEHTAMMIGDIIENVATGRFWTIAPFGFIELEQ